MSQILPPGTKIELHSVKGYDAAFFGFYHVAFLADDGLYYFDSDDKKSIEEALFFYDEHIANMAMYPYVQKGETTYLKGTERRVFKQVLGLPDVVFDDLDLGKDILSQLHFRKGLFRLKRDSYFSVFSMLGKKWMVDDFKVYLLSRGVFFLYDETKRFLQFDDPQYPVFFDEKRIDSKILKPYASFSGARVAIDLMKGECDASFLEYMRRFDAFSLNEQVLYFIDRIPDPRLSKLADDPSRNEAYAVLLRKYVIAIVNMLYDDYFRDVVNVYTNKLSYLTVRKEKDGPWYSLSSYHAEMYSKDGEHFFFSKKDRKRIHFLYKDALKNEKNLSPVLLYSRLGLPFEGFRMIQDDPSLTSKNLFSKLPFQDGVDEREVFLSVKRFDWNYSYVPGNRRHLLAFLLRRLLDQGVYYLSRQDGIQERITIKIFPAKRCPELSSLLDRPSCSLVEKYYLSYCLQRGEDNFPALLKLLQELDKKSLGTALSYYLSSFSDATAQEATDATLAYFHVRRPMDKETYPFFAYVLSSLFSIVRSDFRKQAIRKKDTYILSLLDCLTKPTETYEPDLPLPYVVYGQTVYSFRESYFAKPVLCSCQKEAIEERIAFYGRRFDSFHQAKGKGEEGIVRRNLYILNHLGLPENVYHRMDCRKELSSQILYRDHVCHLCNDAVPDYHEVIFPNPASRRNEMFTYVRAIASKKGLHIGEIRNEELGARDLYESIVNKTYRGILDVDEKKSAPALRKYVELDSTTLMAIFSCFFTPYFQWMDITDSILDFLKNDIASIRSALFSCTPDLYGIILDNPWIFSRLAFFYNRLAVSYAYKEGALSIPGLETDTYVDAVYVSGLPHPYVFLGRVFDGYADSPDEIPLFCESDKKAMKDLIEMALRSYGQRDMDPCLLTVLVLGLAGLPFAAVHALRDFPLNETNVDVLMSRLRFESGICHRCQKKAVPSLNPYYPFLSMLPRKEGRDAEFVSMRNAMAKDGFLLPYFVLPRDVLYEPNYVYSLDAFLDRKIPYFLYSTLGIPTTLSSSLMPSDGLLQSLLKAFVSKSGGDQFSKEASTLILAAYGSDRSIFVRFFEAVGREQTLRELLLSFFPVLRERHTDVEPVMNRILGFFTFLVGKLVDSYLFKEEILGG